MEKRGLYYDIRCRCRLPANTVYRLRVYCGEKQEDLSILVPEQDTYTSITRIAANKIGAGELRFCIVTRHASTPEQLLAIEPDKPFACLAELEQLRLQKREDGLFAERISNDVQLPETV